MDGEASRRRPRLLVLQLRAGAGMAAGLACMLLLARLVIVSVLLPHWLLALAAAAAAEALFYAVVWRRKRSQLDAIPPRHEPPGHDGWSFFERWHASSHYNVKFLAIAELIKCWFHNVPTMEIRRGNAAELVARGYFYKTLAELEAEGKAHLVEQMLLAMERVWGYRFDDGVNPELTYLDHLQEPLKASWRPLSFYLACEAGAALKHAALLAAGFSGHTYGPYTYYTRGLPTLAAAPAAPAGPGSSHQQQQQQQQQPQQQEPLVFLHGVGAGLLPYIPFLLRLTALGRPMLAVEYKHLSMRWTDFIPTAPQVAADMTHMFDRHGVSRAAMVAHSYGTFYVSCLLKLAPEKVSCMALVDPVCCCMWSGHLISNFVYSPARSTTGLITWLIARDIHTAATVSRNFFWTDVNLWPDEVPQHSVFVLSQKDDLVPVQHVDIMLSHEVTNARVIRLPGAHADFLFSPEEQEGILRHIDEMMQQQQLTDARSSSRVPAEAGVEATAAAAHASAAAEASSRAGSGDGAVQAAVAAATAPGQPQPQPDTAAEDLACFTDAVQALQYGLRSSPWQQQRKKKRLHGGDGAGSDSDDYKAGDDTAGARDAGAALASRAGRRSAAVRRQERDQQRRRERDVVEAY